MPLHALTDTDEIAAAYERFAARIREDATPVECNVGWQGGGGVYTVYWNSTAGIWGLSAAEDDHYWFGFGAGDPTLNKAVGNVIAQFGFVREGLVRTRAGVFARDEKGNLFLTHSGGIGGGRSGVGKSAFVDAYNGHFTYVYWPKPMTKAEYIVIGPLDAPDLMERIATFVRGVEKFKAAVAAKKAKPA